MKQRVLESLHRSAEELTKNVILESAIHFSGEPLLKGKNPGAAKSKGENLYF